MSEMKKTIEKYAGEARTAAAREGVKEVEEFLMNRLTGRGKIWEDLGEVSDYYVTYTERQGDTVTLTVMKSDDETGDEIEVGDIEVTISVK